MAEGGNRNALQRPIVHHHQALRDRVVAGIDPGIARQVDADDALPQAYVSAFTALTGTK